MASYTVEIIYSGGPKSQSCVFWYNNSNSGVGTTSSNPLDLQIGDTVTFTATNATGPGTVTVSGLGIFTDNSSFSIAWPNYTGSLPVSVTRTVASGGLTADTVTATHSGANSASDDFFFERQADTTPDGFVSGGWVGSGTTNTTYYASFNSSVTASSTSVGTYTVTGLSTSVTASLSFVSGTQTESFFSVNGASWVTSNQTVSNNDVIRWRVKSASTASTSTKYRLTIGSLSKDLQITTAAPNYTAPVIGSVTNDNAADEYVTATVTNSSNGSGGTLKYAQSTSNSVPGAGSWQTSNQFLHPRGYTRYYWASQDENTAGAYSSSVSHTVGYLGADTAVTPTPTSQTIANAATSASVTVGSVARSTEGVAVRVNNGSTNLATATGNNQTLTWTSSLPTAGNTTTYEIFTRRDTTTGGDGSTWTATNDTFTVTRSQPNATLDLNIGISNYSGPTRYYSNGNTVAASSTVVMMNVQSSYTHELTGCGADTIYYASYTSGASQGSTTAYSNLSPIGRTWTTASTRTLAGSSSSSSSISGPTYSTGDIVYIWAVLNPSSPGGSTITNSTTMTYTGSSYYVERPDTIVSVTPSTTTVGYVSGHPGGTGDTSSPTANVVNDGYTGTQYRLYTTNINRWVSTYNGGGSSTTDFTISYDEASNGSAGTGFTELPSNGNTYTYTTQCRVTSGTPDPINGGGAAWVEVNNNGESFTITRSNANTQPDEFDLGDNATNVSTGTDATSDQITITGLSTGASASFSVTNTSYTKVSKNGGSYNLTTGTVVNNDTLQVQITASSSSGTTRSTTLSVGSPAETDSWSVTTSSGGSSSPGGNTGTVTGGTFGLAIHRATGTNPPVVLDQSNRTNNVIVSGTASIAANSSVTITCPGMTTNNHSEVGAMIKMSFIGSIFTITRGTGQFTIYNSSNTSFNVPYIAFRWG